MAKQQKLLEAIEQQLEPMDRLEQESYAQIRYCDQLFINYGQSHQLSEEIKSSLNYLLPILADIQLQNPNWAWQEHAYIDLLSSIQSHCIGWQANGSKTSQRFLEQFNIALEKTLGVWQQQTLDFNNNPLTDFFASEDKRIQKLEQRVKESESGALKAKRSQELSIRIINEKMQNKALPANIIDFLQHEWHDSLILRLINSDNIQAEFHRLNKLTETLIWTFQPFNAEDNETLQRIYRVIGSLQEELADNLVSLKHQPDKKEELLSTIETEHLRILKGDAVTAAPFTLLQSANPLNSSSTKISGTLLKHVNQLDEGRWFSHSVDGQTQPIKLILKLIDSQQLLFSNHAGMKACQYSFEELAYKLSNSSIKPLPQQSRISQTASILIENLLKIQEHQQEKTAAKIAAQKTQQQSLEEKRQQDREKALAEAKVLQAQKIQKQEQEQELELERKKEQEQKIALKPSAAPPEISFSQQQKFSVMLHQLKAGGMVRFIRNGQSHDSKLAAVTQQANKYIFVNRQGIKDCEILKQELIVQLATAQAEIIDNGDNFEDALSKVVNSIRNKP